MSALTVQEAEALLSDAELAPCVEGGLAEMKELAQACLDAGIAATIGAGEDEQNRGTPRAQLVVRAQDIELVRGLLRDRWLSLVESLGVDVAAPAAQAARSDTGDADDPPCPACGTAAPLVGGACSDCGLQLE